MSLSLLCAFGTAINDELEKWKSRESLFALIKFLEEKRSRHIESYLKSKPSKRFLMRLKQTITSKKPGKRNSASEKKNQKKTTSSEKETKSKE